MGRRLNYIPCVVIVHGDSELKMVRHIGSNLHMPLEIFSRDKGKSSIQITGLLKILSREPFKSISSFRKHYNVEYDQKNKCIKDFKLFIIMDTDDCKENEKKQFMNGEMFKKHWIYQHIVPIYNINNFEDVMVRAEVISKKPNNDDKGKFYNKIFPVNKEPLCYDQVEEMKSLREKLKKADNTNLELFIEYCLEWVEEKGTIRY